jgi:hypothetical protein
MTKEKIDKVDIKIKTFFCIKEIPIEWEKMFAKTISDKGLVFTIYKQTPTIQ